MPAPLITRDLATVIRQKARPGITLWNRLEGRPRATNFERALRAEVRDPLWMLCRQWQVGEFQGDDAGSPVEARVQLATTRLRRYQPGDGAAEAFDDLFLCFHFNAAGRDFECGGSKFGQQPLLWG